MPGLIPSFFGSGVPEYPAITFGTSGLAGRFLIAVLTAVPIFGHSVKTASGRKVFTRLILSGSPSNKNNRNMPRGLSTTEAKTNIAAE